MSYNLVLFSYELYTIGHDPLNQTRFQSYKIPFRILWIQGGWGIPGRSDFVPGYPDMGFFESTGLFGGLLFGLLNSTHLYMYSTYTRHQVRQQHGPRPAPHYHSKALQKPPNTAKEKFATSGLKQNKFSRKPASAPRPCAIRSRWIQSSWTSRKPASSPPYSFQ